jgi:hypothetical protein
MKKSVFVVTTILLLSLLLTSTVSAGAGPKLPTWEQVFNPKEKTGEDVIAIDSVVEFKGKLYFKFGGAGPEDQVWGTKDGENWSLAWQASDIKPEYESIFMLTAFKNQLYLIVADFEEELPGLIMRTPDGRHWEAVATWPLDDIGIWASGGFTSFQGWLYLGACGFITEEDMVCGLWRSISGDAGTWELAVLFPGWNDIASFATFKGALYVSSLFVPGEEELLPAQVYRSFDGVNWEPVTLDGFGDPGNIATWSFGQKDSYLYLGMANGNGGQIWRTKDGMDWQPVTTDGLGDLSNLAFGFVTYQKMLYAYSVNLVEGCRVYASRDGILYTPVNEPGWGDPANSTVSLDNNWAIFKGALYMGVTGWDAPAPGGVYRLGSPKGKP